MDDKTKANWNSVMGDEDWAENYSTWGGGWGEKEIIQNFDNQPL